MVRYHQADEQAKGAMLRIGFVACCKLTIKIMEEIVSRDIILSQVDESCSNLCSEIEAQIPLTFNRHDVKEYWSQPHKSPSGNITSADIWYYEPLKSSKLAHELLHIKCSLVLRDGVCMQGYNSKSQLASALLSDKMVTGIINFTEHIIFYKEYKALGYDIDDMFETTLDSNRPHLERLIREGIKIGNLYMPPKVVEFVMLSMQYALYPDVNRFREEISILNNIDPTLYGIFRRYQSDVKKIKMLASNDAKLQKLYCQLRDDLVHWCERNAKF